MIYDTIIIGGGIAGLYTAYKLIKKNPNHKILILERNRKIGGRIDTYKDKYYTVEAGAARFHERHTLLLKLIEEMGLTSKMVPISSEFEYISTKTKERIKFPHEIIGKVIQKSKLESPNSLKNITFLDYSKQILPPNESQLILDSFGYSSELTDMNAYDTIILIETQFNPKNQFYVLQGGLTQLIEKMERFLETKSKSVKIITKRRVNNINYVDSPQQFEISCDEIQKKYISKKCICAVTKETLHKWPIFEPLYPILKLIKTLPLCRIYSKLSETKSFSISKFTTNNNLRMFIPIDEKSGTMLISYTDNKYADYWNNVLSKYGMETVNKKLRQYMKESLNVEIPMLENTHVFYWKHAVAYFAPGFDSQTMPYQILKPYQDIPLFVCGENFSEKNNQWIEGSLDTSEYILRYM
jgi:protoporphyrinogen oxidase